MRKRPVSIDELNSGQTGAISQLFEFMKGDQLFFLLEGSAGTGKSTCIQFFAQNVAKELGRPIRIALTAPTNKATGVLRNLQNAIGGGVECECVTIYSLLGLKLQKDKPVRQVGAHGENKAEHYDAVVVDEGSMVNKKDPEKGLDMGLWEHMHETATLYGTKFIVMADRYQLPPVGQKLSPVFTIPNGAKLTQVMRHDNQILMLCNRIRELIDQGERLTSFTTDSDENGGVFAMTRRYFNEQIQKGFTSESYSENPDTFRTLAWRNVAVSGYNEQIRHALYGREAEESPFLPGERVVACQPISPVRGCDTEFYLPTDSEGEVISCIEDQHPVYKNLRTYCLKIEPDYGETATAYVIHPDSQRKLDDLLNKLSDNARARKGSWAEFWTLKENIHDVRVGHALTTHRSQGSTFGTAFVDVADILANPDTWEAMRCLYVACSRPSKNLVLCK